MTLTRTTMYPADSHEAAIASIAANSAWSERDETAQIELESALNHVMRGFLEYQRLWSSGRNPMNPSDIAAFNDSLSRCLSRDSFLDDFYLKFLKSSPLIATKFKDTDFDQQKCMVRTSLYMMVMAVGGDDEALEYLDEIAKRHSRSEHDISPDSYGTWLDCLVGAARENDPEFTDDAERIWRSMMQFGIDRMVAQY